MKKFVVFTTILQVLKCITVSIFFITKKPSLLFYIEAGIVEYFIDVIFAFFYYPKRILYCIVISFPAARTAVPIAILGQNFKWRKYLKFKKLS